jgi:hypothetical protein
MILSWRRACSSCLVSSNVNSSLIVKDELPERLAFVGACDSGEWHALDVQVLLLASWLGLSTGVVCNEDAAAAAVVADEEDNADDDATSRPFLDGHMIFREECFVRFDTILVCRGKRPPGLSFVAITREHE